MTKTHLLTRRRFVEDVAKAGVAASVFSIVPRHVLGRGFVAPSDKVNVACIGIGGMGASDVRGLAALPDVRFVTKGQEAVDALAALEVTPQLQTS